MLGRASSHFRISFLLELKLVDKKKGEVLETLRPFLLQMEFLHGAHVEAHLQALGAIIDG
ncbi:MAG: hypothetical protein EOP06_32395 [Proteobacteria bacterium]|nr:MAG: hypothetical protein EOP06_32395 [Pseudomonadota bacterium]